MKTLQLGLDWFAERPGGVPRYYHDFIAAAPTGGIAVRGLVAGSAMIAAETQGVASGFAPHSASLPRRLLAARRATAALVRQWQPDLVAAHFALYALPALGTFRCPLVVHFHGPWAFESAFEGEPGLAIRAKMACERLVYARAARLIVLSEAFASVLADRFAVPRTRIRVIPGGIDTEAFALAASRAEARARLGWPEDRTILLAVRRLVPRMGLDDLIAAIGSLVSAHPDVLLLIGGRGPLAPDLVSAVVKAGLADHVRLLGFIPDEDLAWAWRAADLAVVPSVALEGFGLTAAEALASGTPVVVTPVGGLPEVVQGLDPALVTATTGPDALAAKLAAILSGAQTLPDIARCQAHAREAFGWPRVIGAIRDTYAEVLGNQRTLS